MRNLVLFSVALVISWLGIALVLRGMGLEPHVPHANEIFVPNVAATWSIPDAEFGRINRPGVSAAIDEDPAPMTFWDFGRRASRSDAAIPSDDRIRSGQSNRHRPPPNQRAFVV
jgi:hypothetical protein